MFIFLKEEINSSPWSVLFSEGTWRLPFWNMVQPSVIGYFWWVFIDYFWQEMSCLTCWPLYKEIFIHWKKVTEYLGQVKVWKCFAWECSNIKWSLFETSEIFMKLNFGGKRIKDWLGERKSWDHLLFKHLHVDVIGEGIRYWAHCADFYSVLELGKGFTPKSGKIPIPWRILHLFTT